MVHGLKSSKGAKYNGAVGIARAYDELSGRWKVDLLEKQFEGATSSSPPTFWVKPENICLHESDAESDSDFVEPTEAAWRQVITHVDE